MTTLNFTKITMPAAGLNGRSTLPLLAGIPYKKPKSLSELSETDELWVDYDNVYAAFPYTTQDRYDRRLIDRQFDAVILENNKLKATLMPNFGGKLWSLYDKVQGKELLFSNPVVRYCNLALRNAWTSGGVEFNIGARGHHPYTCETLFTATTKLEDGTPVLRMYEYERMRRLTYQLDFFLPEDSALLYLRVRVVNSNEDATSMYWWSNIAVPEIKEARAIAPCDDAYTFGPQGVYNVKTPYVDGTDVSYSVNIPVARDYFYRIPEDRRRYVAHVDGNGYGLLHLSTHRLKSRKMFVWGQGAGGTMWQKFLSGNGCAGRYVELQAGVGNTQAEHIPMPPKTAWEWLEGYGAITCDPKKAHNPDYHVAQEAVEEKLDAFITEEALEQKLRDTYKMATAKAEKQLLTGSGWGALENARRAAEGDKPLPEYLDFGSVQDDQAPWVELLQNGFMSQPDVNTAPVSYMRANEWIERMEEAVDGADKYNWYTHLQLGCAYYAHRQFRFAEETLNRSMLLKPNCWAQYVLALLEAAKGNSEKSARMMLAAASLNPSDASLAVAATRAMLDAKMYMGILDFTGKLTDEINKLPRVALCRCFALLKTGKLDEAEKLLYADGGIEVTDIKEGEVSITDLWYEIEEAKAARDGKPFDRDETDPPEKFDFRMGTKKKAYVGAAAGK